MVSMTSVRASVNAYDALRPDLNAATEDYRQLITALLDDAGMTLVVLQYPALWIIPLVLVATMLVSALGSQRPPENTDDVLARLHLPESLKQGITPME